MISATYGEKSDRGRQPWRKSSICLIVAGFCVAAIGLMFLHAAHVRQADRPLLAQMAEEVGRLELTDLCLFTEARYTRHLSQADLHAAFQDHPVALEHFPTGSVAGPPAALRRFHGQLD